MIRVEGSFPPILNTKTSSEAKTALIINTIIFWEHSGLFISLSSQVHSLSLKIDIHTKNTNFSLGIIFLLIQGQKLMDFIRKQVDVLKKPFTEGGKLEKLYPAFNAFETMLFVPDHTTSKGSHIRDGVDLKRKTTLSLVIKLNLYAVHIWEINII